MKIGDRVLIKGIVDEIRKDIVIIKNDGGYFGTLLSEIIDLNHEPSEIVYSQVDGITPSIVSEEDICDICTRSDCSVKKQIREQGIKLKSCDFRRR